MNFITIMPFSQVEWRTNSVLLTSIIVQCCKLRALVATASAVTRFHLQLIPGGLTQLCQEHICGGIGTHILPSPCACNKYAYRSNAESQHTQYSIFLYFQCLMFKESSSKNDQQLQIWKSRNTPFGLNSSVTAVIGQPPLAQPCRLRRAWLELMCVKTGWSLLNWGSVKKKAKWLTKNWFNHISGS